MLCLNDRKFKVKKLSNSTPLSEKSRHFKDTNEDNRYSIRLASLVARDGRRFDSFNKKDLLEKHGGLPESPGGWRAGL